MDDSGKASIGTRSRGNWKMESGDICCLVFRWHTCQGQDCRRYAAEWSSSGEYKIVLINIAMD